MNDILSSLKEKSDQPHVNIAKYKSEAKFPVKSFLHPELYILYAVESYEIDTSSSEISIDTGLCIEGIHNATISIFAPFERDFSGDGSSIVWQPSIIMKEPEFLISPKYTGCLEFPAHLLYQNEFARYTHSSVYIEKSDPICYMKVSTKSDRVSICEVKLHD